MILKQIGCAAKLFLGAWTAEHMLTASHFFFRAESESATTLPTKKKKTTNKIAHRIRCQTMQQQSHTCYRSTGSLLVQLCLKEK